MAKEDYTTHITSHIDFGVRLGLLLNGARVGSFSQLLMSALLSSPQEPPNVIAMFGAPIVNSGRGSK